MRRDAGARAMVGGGFRGAGLRSGFVGSRSFAFRPGFAPRFARFNRLGHRRFAFAAAPFAVDVGLYGGSCWTLQPTPWGWQRGLACDYDYRDYGYYLADPKRLGLPEPLRKSQP